MKNEEFKQSAQCKRRQMVFTSATEIERKKKTVERIYEAENPG